MPKSTQNEISRKDKNMNLNFLGRVKSSLIALFMLSIFNLAARLEAYNLEVLDQRNLDNILEVNEFGSGENGSRHLVFASWLLIVAVFL